MASFDITSLFTNLLLNETKDIVLNKLFSSTSHYQGITRSEFEQFLDLSLKDCHLIFDGKLYDQVDGPLSPLFANAFLSSHERVWSDNCPLQF